MIGFFKRLMKNTKDDLGGFIETYNTYSSYSDFINFKLNKNNMGKLQEALALVDVFFSTDNFKDKTLLLGMKNCKENNELIRKFLIHRCVKLDTNREWAKKEVAKPLIFSESSCIKYLKDKGFKIYKPVVEFKEV